MKTILIKCLFVFLASCFIINCEEREWDNPYDEKESKGTFIDPRDGQVYKWIRIGSQVWMAENLRYKFADYTLSSDELTMDKLVPGAIFVYQTNQGRSGKMEIIETGPYYQTFRWVTYDYDGSEYKSNTSTVWINNCFDLDMGYSPDCYYDITGDFKWLLSLMPINHTYFALYPHTKDFDKVVVNKGIYIYENNDDSRKKYGYLYNGYTAALPGLCPPKWRVATDNDWKELEIFLGMDRSDADKEGWRGNIAGKLKEAGIQSWSDPNKGIANKSGFSALPTKCVIMTNMEVYGIGYVPAVMDPMEATFWSIAPHNVYPGSTYIRRLDNNIKNEIFRVSHPNINAYNIRCILDIK